MLFLGQIGEIGEHMAMRADERLYEIDVMHCFVEVEGCTFCLWKVCLMGI
jgi:hypothetical protein